MNVQPLNIQLLLLSLHQLSRQEHHRDKLEEKKILEQHESQRAISLTGDERVTNALPGQQDQQSGDQQGVSPTSLSATHRHALTSHHGSFYDPLRGNIVDVQR